MDEPRYLPAPPPSPDELAILRQLEQRRLEVSLGVPAELLADPDRSTFAATAEAIRARGGFVVVDRASPEPATTVETVVDDRGRVVHTGPRGSFRHLGAGRYGVAVPDRTSPRWRQTRGAR